MIHYLSITVLPSLLLNALAVYLSVLKPSYSAVADFTSYVDIPAMDPEKKACVCKAQACKIWNSETSKKASTWEAI